MRAHSTGAAGAHDSRTSVLIPIFRSRDCTQNDRKSQSLIESFPYATTTDARRAERSAAVLVRRRISILRSLMQLRRFVAASRHLLRTLRRHLFSVVRFCLEE